MYEEPVTHTSKNPVHDNNEEVNYMEDDSVSEGELEVQVISDPNV